MSTIIRGSGDTTFGGTLQSTGIDDNATGERLEIADTGITVTGKVTTDTVSVIGGGTNNPTLVLSASDATSSVTFRGGANTTVYPDFRFNMGVVGDAVTIKNSGDVLVGKTTTAFGTAGSRFISNGQIQAIATSNELLDLNRLSTDGPVIKIYQDGVQEGNIGVIGNTIYIAGASGGVRFLAAQWRPCDAAGNATDNTIDIGQSNVRLDDVYATNGTIQTSDRNEKQDIEELSVAETAVATACKGLLRKFRWQDAVAEKGDDARIHFGIIAQDLQDAFAAEGLDAGDYAMFISTTWYEKLVPVDAVIGVEAVEATYDDEGAELTPAVEAVEAKDAYTRTDTEDEPTAGYTERTRLGVRYPELLAFIISAI